MSVEQKESRNIQELLALIREKPEMYIGASSVIKLSSFLDGYFFAKWQRKDIDDDFGNMNEFQYMVQERYSIVNSFGWDHIIAFFAGDERKGLDLFWELWDEHLAAKSANTAGSSRFYGGDFL